MTRVHEQGAIAVPSVSLALRAEGKIPQRDLIQVDVEGAESALLAGARRLLMRSHPTILIALHGDPADSYALLRSCGYRLTSLDAERVGNATEIRRLTAAHMAPHT